MDWKVFHFYPGKPSKCLGVLTLRFASTHSLNGQQTDPY